MCIYLFILPYCTLSAASVAKKTKLCGDEQCTEKLFDGKFHRSMVANHESFLSPEIGDIVNVYGIKFSDRTDLMEGVLAREPLKRGNFYIMHIDLDTYVTFLKNAILLNKTMYMISKDLQDRSIPQLIGLKSAIPELLKDYKVYAELFAELNNLPKPESIDYAALGYRPEQTPGHDQAHGHSHQHSDGQGHQHSHDHGHHHSHENENQQSSGHGAAASSNEAIQQTQQKIEEAAQRDTPMPKADEQPVPIKLPVEQRLDAAAAPTIASPMFATTTAVPSNTQSPSISEIPSDNSVPTISTQNVPATPSQNPHEGLPPSQSATAPPNIASTSAQFIIPTPSVAAPSQPNTETPVIMHLVPSKLAPSPASAQVPLSSSSVSEQAPASSSTLAPSTPHQADQQNAVPLNQIPIPTEQSVNQPEQMREIPVTVSQPSHSQAPNNEQQMAAPATDAPPQTFVVDKLQDNLDLKLAEALEHQTPYAAPNVPQTASSSPQPAETVEHPEDPVYNAANVETTIKSPETTTVLSHFETLKTTVEVEKIPEIHTDIIEDDGLGYCIKGVCDKVFDKETVEETQTDYLNVIGKWLTREISLCRYILPKSANKLDDAGVVVILFVPICVFIHFVRLFIFADTSDRETFDRRTLHNALTKIRERDIQIKMLRAATESSKSLASADQVEKFENLQMEIGQKQLDVQQLKTRCRMMEEENEHFKEEINRIESVLKKERHKCSEFEGEINKLEKNNRLITEQLAEMQTTMDTAREKSECLEQENNENNAKIQHFESELSVRSIENKKLDVQLQTSLTESRMLRDRVEMLQNETVQLSEIIDEMRNNGNRLSVENNVEIVHENGTGESGWSDFDEFDGESTAESEARRKERTSSPKSSDIMEVARLRVQLKILETDLDQAKMVLQKESNERDHLTRKVELAESEAAKRLKEVEQKEAERVEARNEFKKILSMIEEKEAKIRTCEDVIDRLREDSTKWQTSVHELEEQKKAIDLKLVDVEQELKRLRSEYGRLETRNFHEVRECRQTIAALQQSLEQSNNTNKLNENNLLTMSGTSSSDREFGVPLTGPLGALPLPIVRPLWNDEHPYLSGEPSMVRNAANLHSNNISLDNVNGAYKRTSRTRRGNRDKEYDYTNVEGIHSRPKKEIRRMRSRSQGRHPLNMDYPLFMGASDPLSDSYNYPLLSKQYSKGGSVHYSSGGSNEGRSPPPELALLSGIPPPGSTIKKPIVISRPKSTNEQIERRQS